MMSTAPSMPSSVGRTTVSAAQAASALVLVGIGVVIASIGWAAVALRSVRDIPNGQAAAAAALEAAAPVLLLVGTLHLVAGLAVVAPFPRARLAGAILAAAGAIASLGGIVLLAGGVDPFASFRPTTADATADGVGILAVAFVVYAAVALSVLRSVRSGR